MKITTHVTEELFLQYMNDSDVDDFSDEALKMIFWYMLGEEEKDNDEFEFYPKLIQKMFAERMYFDLVDDFNIEISKGEKLTDTVKRYLKDRFIGQTEQDLVVYVKDWEPDLDFD